MTAGLKWPPETAPAIWMAANSPSPNPNAMTTRSMVELTAFVARIDRNPVRKKTNVPISSASSFLVSNVQPPLHPVRTALPCLRPRVQQV